MHTEWYIHTGYACKHFNTESRRVTKAVKQFHEEYVYRKDDSVIAVIPLIQAMEGKQEKKTFKINQVIN